MLCGRFFRLRSKKVPHINSTHFKAFRIPTINEINFSRDTVVISIRIFTEGIQSRHRDLLTKNELRLL